MRCPCGMLWSYDRTVLASEASRDLNTHRCGLPA
jgi:hypothetical protein